MKVVPRWRRDVLAVVIYTSHASAAYSTCAQILLFPELIAFMLTRLACAALNFSIIIYYDAHHDEER